MSDLQVRLRAFRALVAVRFIEFFREPEAVFWTFVFPIILSVAVGVAFRNRPVEKLSVIIIEDQRAAALAGTLGAAPHLTARVEDEDRAMRDLERGKVAVVVKPYAGEAIEYRFDPSRPEALVARSWVDRALQAAAGRSDPLVTADVEISEPGGRYIDFLIPGIRGMNLMSAGMWGVGFHLVDMRIKKLLKRLVATPMRRVDFMLAQISIRVIFMVVETVFLLGFGYFVFGMPVRGSWAAILFVGASGILCFAGMGLLLASRARRIEGIMGLMNVTMMPMFVCSGIFFSVERFPEAAQPLIRALPLTALIDSFRSLVLDGAPLTAQLGRLAVLAAWGTASFVLGVRWFRWTD